MAAVPAPLEASSWAEFNQDKYLIWLHSLEATIAQREAAGQPELGPLYPLRSDGDADEHLTTLLDVARALVDIESRPRLLQEPAARTPLHALNRARNYAHLAEYDSALVWYAIAASRDTAAEYIHDLGSESLAAAVAQKDTAVVGERLRIIRLSNDPAGHEPEIELAFRFMIARADTVRLRELVSDLSDTIDALSGRVRYWQAFSLAWLGRRAESLAALTRLLDSDGYSHGLDEGQRSWVLRAIPDQLLLLGERAAAEPLYRALAASTVPEAAAWAACQVAAFDLLNGEFLAAGTALERLCRRTDNVLWRQYACHLARLGDELERLRNEGRPYGADVYYQP